LLRFYAYFLYPAFQRREIRDTAPPPAPIGNVSLKVPKKEKVHVNPFGAAKPVVTPIADVAARAPVGHIVR